MRLVAVFFAVSLIAAFPARAHLGDSPEQAASRYGAPVGGTYPPGARTSTRTYSKDGLVIVCGFVKKKIEMYTITRNDRAFLPPEVEAILRTDARHANWLPPGFGPGNYHRADGATAAVTKTQVEIQSPKWAAAVTKDQAAAKASAEKSAQTAQAAAKSANPNYTPVFNTNAASYVEPPATTNTTPASPSPTTAVHDRR